jgi:predicted PurR-regulated permease PerM
MPASRQDSADHETSRERLSAMLFYAAVILIGYLVYLVFEPFLVPLAWAAILVVLFYPWHERLVRRIGRTRAAACSTFGVTCLLILPALGLATLFVREAFQAVVGMQTAFAQGHMPWVNTAWSWLVSHSPGGTGRDLSSLVSQAGETLGTRAAGLLSAVLEHTAKFFFELFVTLFALFFFFRDGDGLMKVLHGVLPFEKSSRDRMIGRARDLIRASVTTSLVVAAVQGIICGTAFAIVGIHAPVFWGAGMAFFSLLPVIGSAVIWAPAVIWQFSMGDWGRAIVLLALCAGLTSLVDSLMRPLLLSGHTRLNTLLIFISVIGGVAVFGAIGLVLGPIVVASATGILDAYTKTRAAEDD